MDVSAWWVLAAFVLGGYAGALLVALISIAADGGHPASGVEAGAMGAEPGDPGWSV